jgi:Secretin and TonB N terminus short domain
MRICIVAIAIILTAATATGACTNTEAAQRQLTNIPAQELAPALQALARERDIQLVYRSELVSDRRTSGARGNLTVEEALKQLLNGTGLMYRYLSETAVTIVRVSSANSDKRPPIRD